MPQNHREAVKWWRKAAEQGHPGAQFSLGSSYFLGNGLPKDYAKAYMWLCLAKEQGHAKAINGCDIVKKQMTPNDINNARILSKRLCNREIK